MNRPFPRSKLPACSTRFFSGLAGGRAGWAWLILSILSIGAAPGRGPFFQITVVDEQTGRGVPLVELRTTSEVRYHTDSNGIIAFLEPGLMGEEVFFHVKSHGYEFPKEVFGSRGLKLKPTAGGSALIKLKRLNIAGVTGLVLARLGVGRARLQCDEACRCKQKK